MFVCATDCYSRKIAQENRHMNVSNKIFKTILALSFIVGLSSLMFGQQLEPSFNVSLNLIVGSNEAGARADLPSDLASVSRQIKGSFTFSNYRLGGTLI